MALKQIVGKYLNKALGRLGYRLTSYSELSLTSALERISSRSIMVNTVIDIGASDGRWSVAASEYFPDAAYFLIDANTIHEPSLRELTQNTPNIDFVIAAASDTVGEIYFDAREPFGGIASHEPLEQKYIVVPATTVDVEVQKRGLKPPFVLKLDTHGFEVPIFNGAETTLLDTNLIVVETYNFTVANNSLKFWEVCSFLATRGFRPIDLCDPLHRPSDKAFWQIDLFFIRADSPEFASNAY